MHVLVCGGRNYADYFHVRDTLDELHQKRPITRIVHGACGDDADNPRGKPAYRGADKWADMWALLRGVECHPYPAHWTTLGKKAGFLRNQQMLDEEIGIELVVAFPGDEGTADMVRRAKLDSLVHQVLIVPRHNRSMKKRSEKSESKEETVEEISKKLNKELHPDQAADDEPLPFNFESANAPRKAKLREDLDKIVEVVFVNNMQETWERLRKALVIGEKRSDHGTLQQALDRAEKNAHDAHRLYVTAKVEHQRWERENDVVFSAMWSKANRSLQKEKDDGLRSKQITDADIKARMATLWPDEYSAQETRRAKVKATVEALEDLAEQWKSRCRTLQTMMGKLRS